ncbi:MAG: DUF3501 family protein [Gammaproteobacteria bacterium]|nr:DUF3501 family protein [Gammaproteobacteria bacterium]MBU6509757.1 DUF3501 family protein [Gammaproteobacteria bacterium]MDE1984523.1 DUF3501 family protein [Gammaproteobacteria bacterium]MDE2108294.1 DUF3501 family protein [Gammaproteobacteria bacterium]MDE2459612.1 DUF3501 family protein [Gammaproteobacteria bacterium]
MQKLTRKDLWSLEDYAQKRDTFRQQVMAHKQNRSLQIGSHLRLLFEDRMTMQYQVQEMLRAERIFEVEGIQDELDTYNELIPDGGNWKATLLIEYEDIAERQKALAQLIGIEDKVWVQVVGQDKVYAIADEDMQRERADKTSAVHFLRFELTPEMVKALKSGAKLTAGVDHAGYNPIIEPVSEVATKALLQDLD